MVDRLLDLRSERTAAQEREACLLGQDGKPASRQPTGITLHQTACFFTVAPFQVKASKGDETLARHRRALNVHAHITAFRSGKFVVAYDLDTYVQHGDLLNGEDIGLEHEGLFDVNGVPVSPPRGYDLDAVIEAGRAAVEWIVNERPSVRYIHAHRQSRRPGKGRTAKTSDPGRRIFQDVGMWAVRRFGLQIEPDRVLGVGKALPRDWYE